MASEEQLNLIRQGVEKWNQWRDKNNNIRPGLSKADLRETQLQKANLSYANLERSQFNEDALFKQTNLKGANLKGTTGLSSSQIKLAITDKQTRLPDYLEEEVDDDFLLQI